MTKNEKTRGILKWEFSKTNDESISVYLLKNLQDNNAGGNWSFTVSYWSRCKNFKARFITQKNYF